MVVGDIIRQTTIKYPNKLGVVFNNNRYSWREVNARVNSMAHSLLELGLNKQDRVAILCQNCNQYLEFYLATAKAGLIAVPLNTWLRKGELEYLIKDSGAKVLITDVKHMQVTQTIQAMQIEHYIGLGKGHNFPCDMEKMLRKNSTDEPQVNVHEEDVFVIAYTSGTIGKPKGAVLTHKNACTAIMQNALEWRLLPNSVYLLHAPMFFAASGGSRLHAVLRGCTCIIIAYDIKKILKTIETERVTHFSMSPTPIRRILDYNDISKYDLSSVQMIGLTGGPHSTSEIKKIENVFGHIWYSAYGMTEVGPLATILQPEEVTITGPQSQRIASVGKAITGVDIRVVDDNGNDIAHNGKGMGEVILKGDNVMKSYWNMPEETAKVLKDGWFYSGDLATVDDDGYIYIVDRKKDIIISGGINISSKEIEEVIYTHPAVAHCTVIGIPDHIWGETPKAVVKLKVGTNASQQEIIELCKENLASYKAPTSVDFVDDLPLGPSGKILKREIKMKYWKGYQKMVH